MYPNTYNGSNPEFRYFVDFIANLNDGNGDRPSFV